MGDGNNIYDGPSFAEYDPYDDLDRTESACDWFDHDLDAVSVLDEPLPGDAIPNSGEVREKQHTGSAAVTTASRGGVQYFPRNEAQLAYWESDEFLNGHNGEQPHE